MNKQNPLSTAPYKGVRDFYPADMAVQEYITTRWSMAAEKFGFVQYGASVLEPSDLYRSKAAENSEIINDQTYTFTDRGNREVTLRPEMTPTVARMVAGKRRELTAPIRWYSIPNLFRYERAQRGRLREHWQLNCDIFGVTSTDADVEIALLIEQIFTEFGATNGTHFDIHVSSRRLLDTLYAQLELSDEAQHAVTQLADRKRKMEPDEFESKLRDAAPEAYETLSGFFAATALADIPTALQAGAAYEELHAYVQALAHLDVHVQFDPSIVRGFNYYTGIVFEVFDLHPENRRALLGGGRYDNLTELFGGEAITGVGFGMGDVTMRDFLESHDLLPQLSLGATLTIIPHTEEATAAAQALAQTIRAAQISVAVDISERKLPKKITAAADAGSLYTLVLGENEQTSGVYTLKHLASGTETTGTPAELITTLSTTS